MTFGQELAVGPVHLRRQLAHKRPVVPLAAEHLRRERVVSLGVHGIAENDAGPHVEEEVARQQLPHVHVRVGPRPRLPNSRMIARLTALGRQGEREQQPVKGLKNQFP